MRRSASAMCARKSSKREGIISWPSKRISPVYYGKSSTNLPRKTRPFPPYQQQQRQFERQTARTIDKGHGRRERRTLTSTIGLHAYLDWPPVGQVGPLGSRRFPPARFTTNTAS